MKINIKVYTHIDKIDQIKGGVSVQISQLSINLKLNILPAIKS